MKPRLSVLMFALMVFFSNALLAQSDAAEEGLMRSNGKIFVVMAVSLIILLGLVLFLVRLDRKISRLEKGE